MKICHVCLCGYFSEGFGYQDNLMVEENIKNGNEVSVIASQYQMEENGSISKEEKGIYKYKRGLTLYRIPFVFDGLSVLNNKIRKYKGLYKILVEINPDIIFVHGLQFVDIKEVVKYKKRHKNINVYADNHASIHNSAKNLFSKYILHRLIYKHFIQQSKDSFIKIFNVTYDCETFIKENYKIHEKLHLLPLCGKFIDNSKIKEIRKEIRNKHNIDENQNLYIHAGKLDKAKKTIETMKMFNEENENSILFIVGSVSSEIEKEFHEILLTSNNIKYLGWKSSEELINYLCATDIFIQIGSQSILFQQAISCENMIILDKNINTDFLVSNNNGITIKNVEELRVIFKEINENKIGIEEYKKNSYEFAKTRLNYKSQSKEYLEV